MGKGSIARFTSGHERCKRLRIGFSHSPDPILLTDENGIITEANRAAQKLLRQKSANNIIGEKITGFLTPCDKKKYSDIISRREKKLSIKNFLCTVPAASGSVAYVEASCSSLSDKSGNILGYVVTLKDVSRRKEYETALKRAVKEKKVLLKEVHHRVKNSLQIIHSILSLQTSYLKSPETVEILEECQHRIRTMSFVHECLYKSKKLTRINLNEYINELMRYLYQAYVSDNKEITLYSEIENIELDLQMATSCGMIYNELISNSLKHAFRDLPKGNIRVTFRREGVRYSLIVQDDGNGISTDEKSGMPKSFGMRLVSLLSDQLNGELTIKAEKGTIIGINFPIGGEDL